MLTGVTFQVLFITSSMNLYSAPAVNPINILFAVPSILDLVASDIALLSIPSSAAPNSIPAVPSAFAHAPFAANLNANVAPSVPIHSATTSLIVITFSNLPAPT